jgi:cytochrome P450
VGNLHQIKPAEFHRILERWAAQYGSPYLFRLLDRRIVVVTDPQWAEQALRARPETFRRPRQPNEIILEMGLAGVFSAEGESWRPQRKLSVAALAQRHFRALYPNIQTVATRLLSRWRKSADAGTTIDLVAELRRFTVDVTVLLTFGYDINTIEQDGDVIQQKLDLIFPAIVRRMLSLFPTWRYLRSPKDRELDRSLADMRAWLQQLTDAARARLLKEPERRERPANFIEAMLAARDDEGKPFSDEVIFGNLMTMLLAGEDTTANTLAWAVHELFDCRQASDALRREAIEVLGSAEAPGSVDQANALLFAGAVANETMRLRPVAPLNFVEALVDTVVGDLAIPKGVELALLTRPPAIEPANFHEPEAFSPERWLASGEGAHNVGAHMPFGSGPRICPGRSLALVEMNTVLSMLYKNFEIERVGARDDVSEEFGFTMSPLGLKVRMRRR